MLDLRIADIVLSSVQVVRYFLEKAPVVAEEGAQFPFGYPFLDDVLVGVLPEDEGVEDVRAVVVSGPEVDAVRVVSRFDVDDASGEDGVNHLVEITEDDRTDLVFPVPESERAGEEEPGAAEHLRRTAVGSVVLVAEGFLAGLPTEVFVGAFRSGSPAVQFAPLEVVAVGELIVVVDERESVRTGLQETEKILVLVHVNFLKKRKTMPFLQLADIMMFSCRNLKVACNPSFLHIVDIFKI